MGKVGTITDEHAENGVLGDGTVVLDFGSHTCAPCRAMAPSIERLVEEHDECVVYQVDVEETPSIADRYGVRGIPALLFLTDGAVQDRLVGGRSYTEIKSWYENNLKSVS